MILGMCISTAKTDLETAIAANAVDRAAVAVGVGLGLGIGVGVGLVLALSLVLVDCKDTPCKIRPQRRE